MTGVQKTVVVMTALIALVLGLTVNKVLNGKGEGDPVALLDAGIVLLPQSRTLPAVQLSGTDGAPFALQQLNGKWSLLFFGYTFCPDICPTTLAQLRELRGKLPVAARDNLQLVFVSIDPQRDTPEHLKQYLGFYQAGFIGLTGELPAIQTLANAVSIPFIPADTSQENYTVDHSGNLVLLGPDGRQRGFIRQPLNNQKLLEQLPGLLSAEQ
ncbi:SCO family protein [Pseudomonas sp. N040]|uniref:SCO family protein n=1 Tax=Pseudomonas sp. N040 TaxID=2785325 RepID=UPI0018A2F79A|nr:SCO family protein [Pseudomonas sp. N040]MBF7728825.1 SCO family protein [Pseudomonas sp. N040]MBW7012465.1 SCO family protein [Pseudomonas sp. N040]